MLSAAAGRRIALQFVGGIRCEEGQNLFMKKRDILLTLCALLCVAALGGCGKKAAAFEYIYRGFVIQDNEQAVPEGIRVIDSPEQYEAFLSAYGLGAVYPLEQIDFAQEVLIYYGGRSAMPTRGWAGEITSVMESLDGTHGLILGMDEELRYGGERQQEAVAYQIMTDTAINVAEVHMLKVKKDALSEETVRANAWQTDM